MTGAASMHIDEEVEEYIASFGAAVPDAWRLWWDDRTKRYLVINLDKDGKEFGHMIDDDKFADRVVEYLRARGVQMASDADQGR
jgi:hypothetical protein